MFHPLFGTCFVFRLEEARALLGRDGPRSVMVTVDMEDSFRRHEEEEGEGDAEDENEEEEEEVQV